MAAVPMAKWVISIYFFFSFFFFYPWAYLSQISNSYLQNCKNRPVRQIPPLNKKKYIWLIIIIFNISSSNAAHIYCWYSVKISWRLDKNWSHNLKKCESWILKWVCPLKTTAPLPVLARGCQRSLCLHSDPSTRQRRSCRPLTGRHEEGHGRRNLSLKVRQEHLSVKPIKQHKHTKHA